jgi:hypothetical protein
LPGGGQVDAVPDPAEADNIKPGDGLGEKEETVGELGPAVGREDDFEDIAQRTQSEDDDESPRYAKQMRDSFQDRITGVGAIPTDAVVLSVTSGEGGSLAPEVRSAGGYNAIHSSAAAYTDMMAVAILALEGNQCVEIHTYALHGCTALSRYLEENPEKKKLLVRCLWAYTVESHPLTFFSALPIYRCT